MFSGVPWSCLGQGFGRTRWCWVAVRKSSALLCLQGGRVGPLAVSDVEGWPLLSIGI